MLNVIILNVILLSGIILIINDIYTKKLSIECFYYECCMLTVTFLLLC